MKLYVEDFTLKHFLLNEIFSCEICEKFVYKHSETEEYAKSYLLLRNLQTSRPNNSRILRKKNA